jgi:hypothetical protein
MQKLDKKPDKNPFKVPDNYFEEVNRKILSATSGYDHEVRKTGLFIRLKPYLAVAAAIAGFIIIGYIAVTIMTPEPSKVQLSEVVTEENGENYLIDIDVLTLEEQASTIVVPDDMPSVSKKDIMEYLLLNNIEISDIYEQL